MMEPRFSPAAREDLAAIHDFIAADDPGAALNLIDRIEHACHLIAENPMIGETCDFLAVPLRMLTVGNYVIFHRPANDGSEIVRVLHGARDWRRLF